MEDLLVGAVDDRAGAKLQQAAEVGSDDGLRASGLGVVHFFREQFEGCVCLRDVEDSGGAAADFRVRQFHKMEIGNGAQERARSFANFLAVKEMAGILVGDADWKRFQSCGEAESGEEFSDVASLGGKFACLAVLFLALRGEMMVFLERGAAAGGVGDDGVEVFAKKYGEILSREFAGGIANARVRSERAAAELAIGDDGFAAVGGKDADGGFVQLRKSNVGNAAGEEGDAGAARTGGGKRPNFSY